jgi:hypothetical protein
VNEILSRALLRARLTDEDVAARLEVDPKTVRRWLDGRVPYLRHRWALAQLLGMDESDLWPQLQAARSRPGEVTAVYPHRDSVPAETWLRLFGSARREAGVLADSAFLLADESAVLRVLAERASSGVRVRVCLTDPIEPDGTEDGHRRNVVDPSAVSIRDSLRPGEFRIHRARSYNTICYADDDLFATQHVYGQRTGQAPVLYLRRGADGDMAAAYLGSFDRIWADARTLD